jgi:peptide deformylase
MAIRPIELYGSPVLRKVAAHVREVTPEVQQLLDDMVETMRFAGGAGLAAPQVGVSLRVMVVDLGAREGEENIVAFINPEFLLQEGEAHHEEGCLSLPEVWETVRRPAHIRVRAQDREGKHFEMDGEEFLCRAVCHEIDHLDGVLFIDRLPPIRRDMIKRKIKKMIRDGEWDDYYEKKVRKRSQPGPVD